MKPSINILIVEDEQIVALDLKRRLSKLGYRVIGMAANAVKALALVDKEPPNIVLMDIHIQGNMDGIEVAAMLQKKYFIPVIYLTAYSEEKTLSRARATKPYGYLLKPFSERELHVMIQVAMERYETDSLVRKHEQHLNLALEAARLGTWEVMDDGTEVFIGKSPEGLLEPISDWNEFYASIADADRQGVADMLQRLRDTENIAAEIEFRVHCKANIDCWYKLYGRSYSDGVSGKHRIVGVLQDTSESRNINDRLLQAATVFECTAEGIIILDRNKKVDCANDAFYKITGYQSGMLDAKQLPFLTRHFLGADVYNSIWGSIEQQRQWQGEIRMLKHNDELMYAWLNIGIVPGPEDEVQQYVVVISDITAIREAQDRLSRLAYFDSLTDLPNRMLIMDRLKQALARARRESTSLGVLFIDLDNFKRINDTMGHQVGDDMLRVIAKRLESELRYSDTLGRLGGDEFVVIMERLESHDAIKTVSDKLLSSIASPLVIGNTEIIPSCSIGISLYPDDSDDQDELLQMADTAMYAAKNKGRSNYIFYEPGMTQSTAHYLTREMELRRALESEEFVLHFQPQCSMSRRRVIGLEALIRWQHPEKGLLSPIEIIPIAEASNLIVDIGNWVLEEACRQLSEWRRNGLQGIRMAVNVSIRQLADKRLPEFIEQLLHRYSLPPHLLELEVTESCLQHGTANVICLQKLEKLGVPISIDDFGTGYSCMSSLKHLPIRRLKIDQAFVRDIPGDKNDCAIASAIIALGRQLNMQVIAEGVETIEQLEFLTSIGCEELQGYYFSNPVGSDEIPALIANLHDHIRSLRI